VGRDDITLYEFLGVAAQELAAAWRARGAVVAPPRTRRSPCLAPGEPASGGHGTVSRPTALDFDLSPA
jgi:hypothetical protein